jgi:hypothetical protein
VLRIRCHCASVGFCRITYDGMRFPSLETESVLIEVGNEHANPSTWSSPVKRERIQIVPETPKRTADITDLTGIGTLILAAGASTRASIPKQLLQFRGQTLLRRAACAGRFRSIPAINSGMLIGLARNGCPWIRRPDLVSALVTRAVKKTTGVLCNVGSDSIRAATSPPSVSGIAISRRIRSGWTRCAVW